MPKLPPGPLPISAMLTRRSFVNYALSLSTVTISIGARRASPTSSSLQQDDLHLAIFDARFVAGRVFGEAMCDRRVPVAGYLGDVTPVWYTQLDPVWRHAPIAVGGVTTAGALFCLEHLAWEHGMRVVYRGTHRDLIGGGGTEHLLESCSNGRALLRATPSGFGLWPVQIASLITRMANPSRAFGSPLDHRSRVTCRTYRAELQSGNGLELTSWLIVPHTRRS